MNRRFFQNLEICHADKVYCSNKLVPSCETSTQMRFGLVARATRQTRFPIRKRYNRIKTRITRIVETNAFRGSGDGGAQLVLSRSSINSIFALLDWLSRPKFGRARPRTSECSIPSMKTT